MAKFAGFRTFFNAGEEPQGKMMDSEVVNLYLHNPGIRVSELAQTAGLSIPDFYRVLHKYNVQPCRLGQAQGLVRTYHEDGYSIPEIASLTGYTPRNIRYILSKTKITLN